MAVDFQDYIDMQLNEEGLESWDGASGGFQDIENGEYTFEILSATVKQSKKGNPTMEVQLKVVSDGPMKDRECRQWYSLKLESRKARERLKQLTEVTGTPRDERGGFSAAALVGAQYVGVLYHEPYTDNDKDGNEIERQGIKIRSERSVPRPAAPATTVRGRAPVTSTRPRQ